MTSIATKKSETSPLLSTRPADSVETAGSLAVNVFYSLFDNNSHDEFFTSNPFAVDYSQYSNCGESIAWSGFLSDFSNAVSTLGSDCTVSSGECSGGFSGGDCGGSSFIC